MEFVVQMNLPPFIANGQLNRSEYSYLYEHSVILYCQKLYPWTCQYLAEGNGPKTTMDFWLKAMQKQWMQRY